MANKIIVAMGAILIVVLILGMFALPAVIITACEEQPMEISCSTEMDCSDFFADQGAPVDWLDQQQFSCNNNMCFIIPSDCDAEQVQVAQ